MWTRRWPQTSTSKSITTNTAIDGYPTTKNKKDKLKQDREWYRWNGKKYLEYPLCVFIWENKNTYLHIFNEFNLLPKRSPVNYF